ncbi:MULTISPECIES: hypothetical protein [unclassified Granulicatella]|uniref:hypothetical protein n=1 Tax=unclassified Granulicatella TaxID=2630493 RepID=UPI001073A3F7|nr:MULTISPECIES: hypothetical protein [unclassified Granulicatella]MBF0781055.1 hypothetical protein [Granulicatella sp. 19428wC4_WM01]TFU92433.1 hypothetical protein E4T68_08055 [Granulicatella sp. WM01]
MGRLKKIYVMRMDALVIYVFFCFFIVLLYAIFGYMRAFFSSYQTLQYLFSFGQIICIVLSIAIIFMIYFQFKKAGKFSFYQYGIVNEQTKEEFFYHDIVYYEFIPQNNKTAKGLLFKTKDDRQGELLGLLPSSAFKMFQDDHTTIWAPFMIEQIKQKELFRITVQEDTTSFKLLMDSNDEKDLVLSHQGIVIYDTFYHWNDLLRYQISWNGMFGIKDKENRTIFLEPSTSLSNYRLLLAILDYFIPVHESEGSHG